MDYPPAKALIASLARLHTNGKLSDFKILCSNDVYDVHKAIISARSEYFMKACQFGKEITEGAITFPNEERPFIKGMVEFLYTNEYSLPNVAADADADPRDERRATSRQLILRYKHKESHNLYELSKLFHGESARSSVQEKRMLRDQLDTLKDSDKDLAVQILCNGESHVPTDTDTIIERELESLSLRCQLALSSFCTAAKRKTYLEENAQPRSKGRPELPKDLLLHAHMYAMADKYLIEGMQHHAKERFKCLAQEFYDTLEFATSIDIICETTPESNKGLRQVLARVISDHWGWMCMNQGINDSLERHPGVAYMVLCNIGLKSIKTGT